MPVPLPPGSLGSDSCAGETGPDRGCLLVRPAPAGPGPPTRPAGSGGGAAAAAAVVKAELGY